MTQRELAEKAMTTEVSMSRFVSGARVPNGPILANIAKTLGVTTDYLVGKSDKTEGWTGNWIPCEKEMPAENEDILGLDTVLKRKPRDWYKQGKGKK